MGVIEIMVDALHKSGLDDALHEDVEHQLAALQSAGFAIAPIEPTEAMVNAGLFANGNALLMVADCNDARNAYRAMIAASQESKHD